MTTRYQVIQEGGVFDFQTRAIIRPHDAAWQDYRKWLTEGNVPLPPDKLGMDDLDTAKAKRVEEIDAYAAGQRNKVVAGRSAGEMASWSPKLAEAKLFSVSGLPADAPMLVAIAAVRGITTAALVEKVLAQATIFLNAEAAIDGVRGKHCDAINAMTDVRDIVTYNWLSGWPV